MILLFTQAIISNAAFELYIDVSLTSKESLLGNLGIYLFSISWTISSILLWRSISIDGISLRVVFWFYAFVFMGLAPVMQAFAGIWLYDFDVKNFFTLTLAIFLAYIFFILSYVITAQKYKQKIKYSFQALGRSSSFRPNFFIDGNRVFLFSITAALLSVTLTLIYGFHFTSSIISTMFNNSFSSTYQLVEYFVRPLLFFGFSFCLYAVMGGYNRPLLKFSLALLSVSVFLIIGPLSGARSIIFFLYFGLFIILFRKALIRHPIVFGSLLFAGVFGSELQNVLRGAFSPDGEVVFAGISYFYQGHFDGFEMFGHAVGYIEREGLVFGSQLLGAILFWVPRSIWPDKPIGSGDFIAYEYISERFPIEFDNFSMPLMAEAYINFGLFGVCFIFLLVGAFCGKEDTRFHVINKYQNFREENYFSSAATMGMWRYVTFLGIFLFLLRGDLMSGFSFLFGIYTALIFAWFILHGRPFIKNLSQ